MLNINRAFENGKAVLELEGKVDTNTFSQFAKELPLGDSSLKELVLDCKKLEYISSAGLRVILSAINALAGRGTIRLVGVNDSVREILEMTGFADELTIE